MGHRKAEQHQLQPESNSQRLANYRSAVLFERRIVVAVTFFTCIASLIWLVALFTDYWVLVKLEEWQRGNNGTAVMTSPITTFEGNSGLWSGCVQRISPAVNHSTVDCSSHNLDGYLQEVQLSSSIAKTIIDYRRTVVALTALSLLIVSMAVIFSCYTFHNSRYTFKRLAAAIHFLSAATMVVLIEVVSGGVAYAHHHILSLHPKDSVWRHGYSYYLAWAVFVQFLLSGCVFLFYSRKRKTSGILNEDGTPIAEDEPQVLGR